jgi:allophanate hydrolase subunit 2
MQIGDDHFRPCVVELWQISGGAFECGVRLLGFEIADVLADKDLFTDGKRNGVLQVRTNGQNWLRVEG